MSPALSIAKLNAAFPQYGTYVATAGTLSINMPSSTQYVATPAEPITLIYQQNYFSIQRSGTTLVTFGLYNSITSDTYTPLYIGNANTYLIVSDKVLLKSGQTGTSNGCFSTYSASSSLQVGGYAGYAEMTNIVPKTNGNYIGTIAKPYRTLHVTESYFNSCTVSSSSNSGKVTISGDSEGGNIAIFGPSGAYHYEIDSYQNSYLRLFALKDGVVKQCYFSGDDGSIHANKVYGAVFNS